MPNVAEGGGWAVRKAVGNTPAIISNALSQQQYVGDGYIEVDIDVEVSAVAQYILGVVRPLAVAQQGQSGLLPGQYQATTGS